MDVYQTQEEVSLLHVRLVRQTFIKATSYPFLQQSIPLSNFDRLVIGFPVTLFYAYQCKGGDLISSILTTIKSSLSEALNHFLPFAGQILSSSDEAAEIVVLCNNVGLRFLEASANVPLANLDFHNQTHTNKQLLLPIDHDFPLNVQFTTYTCGNFSISWTFDHSITDAFGFIQFLLSWCEIARGDQNISVVDFFNHDRHVIIRPRSPPTYDKLVDETYTCILQQCVDPDPPPPIRESSTEQRLYLVQRSSLESLRALSSEDGSRKTRTEALSAHLWKLMASTHKNDDARCKIAWAVDGRRRIKGLSNFTGNVMGMAVQERRAQDLKEGTLSYVAGMVSGAIGEVANRDHFLNLIDWLDCHRSEKVMPSVFLDDDGAASAVVVSSCHDMPVMSVDFGVGPPLLGMFCSTLERLGAGYVNLISSGRGDGSWVVSAFIWPELVAALEADPEHVFESFRFII